MALKANAVIFFSWLWVSNICYKVYMSNVLSTFYQIKIQETCAIAYSYKTQVIVKH